MRAHGFHGSFVAVLGLCLPAQAPPAPKVTAPPRPLREWPLDGKDPPPCVSLVTDVVAWRAAWQEGRRAPGPVPDVDFARQCVLVVGRPLAPRERLAWQGAERDGESWRIRVGPAAGADPAAAAAGGMFLLPRPELPLAVAWPRGEGWLELARLPPPPPPAAGDLLCVLRAHEQADGPAEAAGSGRATTAAEWRDLRRRLGLPADALPDDWADFGSECVVAVRTARARVWPGFALRVGSEEDVDVLTLTQRAPSGADPGERTPCIVLALPRRPCALALVLRTECGPAPGSERTLATFPALR